MSRRAAVPAVLAGAALALPAAPAAAAAVVEHGQSVAGAVISCGSRTYTVTEGTLGGSSQDTTSASGNVLSRGSVHLKAGLTDASGAVYRLVGSTSRTLTEHAGEVRESSTAHFLVVAQGGGVVDRVALTGRTGADGSFVVLDRGSCEFPD